MRILIVTHYFPPETGAPQARLSALAAAWAAGGDDVTVLTGMPNHPTGVVPPELGEAKIREAWPAKWTGPTFNAEAHEVAIQTLELAHEGIDVE